jgi:hypothetical protein
MSTTVQKVDPTGEQGPDDASIPVLTERLTLPPLELDTTLPMESAEAPASAAVSPTPAPAPAPAPVPAPMPVPAARPAVAASTGTAGTHWTRIELELRASIFKGIAESLPQEVEAIVRSRMSDVIDKLMAQLAAETRLAMAASLRDIVDHAVHAELDRLRRRNR